MRKTGIEGKKSKKMGLCDRKWVDDEENGLMTKKMGVKKENG